jgi:hypothetical protein
LGVGLINSSWKVIYAKCYNIEDCKGLKKVFDFP